MTGTITIRPVTARDLGLSPGAIAARAMYAEVAAKVGAQNAMRCRAAFDGIEHAVDNALTAPKPGKAIRVIDEVLPGDAVVLLVDPHPRRYFICGQVDLPMIAAARSHRLTVATRRKRALALARGVWRSVGGPVEHRPTLEMYQRSLAELAALVLDDVGFVQLDSVGAVPMVLLMVDTRTTGPTAGSSHSLVSPLPDLSLKTMRTAGFT
ncbi:hypothetical protein [Methylobacterium komagatae]